MGRRRDNISEEEMLQALDDGGYVTHDIVGDSTAIIKRYSKLIGIGGSSRSVNPGRGQGSRQKIVKTGKDVQRTAKREPGQAPKGYDQEIWHLAMGFQQGAEFCDVTLKESLPLIYFKLEECFNKDKVIKASESLQSKRVLLGEKMLEQFWNHWNWYDLSYDQLPYDALQMFYFHWNLIRDTVTEAERMRYVAEKLAANPSPPKPRTVRKPRPETQRVWGAERHGGPGGGAAKAREYLRRKKEIESREATDHEDS